MELQGQSHSALRSSHRQQLSLQQHLSRDAADMKCYNVLLLALAMFALLAGASSMHHKSYNGASSMKNKSYNMSSSSESMSSSSESMSSSSESSSSESHVSIAGGRVTFTL